MKEIRVCSNCGVPMIWTFAFDGWERYCLNCGNGGGMLGTGDDVPATRELIFQQKMVEALWKVIYGKKGLIPNSARRTNCDKCRSLSEPHSYHLTKAEAEWDKIARRHLDIVQGFLNKEREELWTKKL